eukprot:757955-Hanusia_phi.AAC.4
MYLCLHYMRRAGRALAPPAASGHTSKRTWRYPGPVGRDSDDGCERNDCSNPNADPHDRRKLRMEREEVRTKRVAAGLFTEEEEPSMRVLALEDGEEVEEGLETSM